MGRCTGRSRAQGEGSDGTCCAPSHARHAISLKSLSKPTKFWLADRKLRFREVKSFTRESRILCGDVGDGKDLFLVRESAES